MKKFLATLLVVWSLFFASTAEAAIEKFAQDSYRQKYLVKVKSKIRNLSAEAAQKYLEELIDKDTLLGIRVLKDS